jgi:CDP-glucose 4,6-dehydratase
MTSIADSDFWRGRRVLVTGHTGFKGTWLVAMLLRRGARVAGVALQPDTTPSLWHLTPYAKAIDETIVDVRDADTLDAVLARLRPQTVFHLAAQSLVRRGYAHPRSTYAINVMGTVNVLDALRRVDGFEHAIVVTSDKVYADRPRDGGYPEDARLGGADPYAGSKAAAELVAETYRSAYFAAGARIVTARAGNVIGGGDFAEDRLIPDAYRACAGGLPLVLRRPDALRPWQHVLEPLHGYVVLAEAIAAGRAPSHAYNFGPVASDDVRSVAERFVRGLGADPNASIRVEPSPEHETHALAVDSTRARRELAWSPRWDTARAVDATAAWYRDFLAGERAERLVERDLSAYAG